MTLGDVRSLNTWLRQHATMGPRVRGRVGQWGNEADPSALWIEYLSQEAIPGLDWSGLILAGAGAGSRGPPAQETPPRSLSPTGRSYLPPDPSRPIFKSPDTGCILRQPESTTEGPPRPPPRRRSHTGTHGHPPHRRRGISACCFLPPPGPARGTSPSARAGSPPCYAARGPSREDGLLAHRAQVESASSTPAPSSPPWPPHPSPVTPERRGLAAHGW